MSDFLYVTLIMSLVFLVAMVFRCAGVNAVGGTGGMALEPTCQASLITPQGVLLINFKQV